MTDRDPFTQLTGAFDRPVTPSPDFAARLRGQVVAELADDSHADTSAAGLHPVSSGVNSSVVKEENAMPVHGNGHGKVIDLRTAVPSITPNRLGRGRRLLRWLPALEVAAALLLIMALFGELIGPVALRNAVVPDLFEPTRRLESQISEATTGVSGDLPTRALAGRHQAGLPVAGIPSPETMPVGTPSTSEGSPTERSTLAGGSWTFDAAVPATAPGTPEVFSATDEGTIFFTADVESDTLVGLAGTSPYGYGDLSVEARSLTSGERLWVVPFENPAVPIIADGRVFIHDGGDPQNGTNRSPIISALDLATGDELWRVPFTGQSGAFPSPSLPLVVRSTLYVADDLGVIQALDVATGNMRWQAPSGAERALSPGGAPLVDLPSFPVADNQHVYTLTADGTFRALNLETGQSVWEVPILGTYAAPIYNVNALTDGTTVVLNISTFTENSDATPAHFSGPALTTVALNALDGLLQWQRASALETVEAAGAPILIDGLLLAYDFGSTSNGRRPMTALRATDGQEIWRTDAVPHYQTLWSVGGDHAVSAVSGALIANNLATGEEAWRVAMPPFQGGTPPLITEDAIIVVSTDGRIVVWRI